MKSLLVIIAVSICFTSLAQYPVYFTDMIKGDVTVQRKNKSIVPVKYHDFIMQEDIIIIGKGGELTLVNKNDSYVLLNKKGKYPVASIIEMPQSEETGIIEIYFKHVWDKIRNTSGNSSETKRTVRSLGGVERNSDCDLVLFPFPYWITAADSLCFEWSEKEKGRQYAFLLMNEEKQTLLRLNTCDTQIVIARSLVTTNSGSGFYWRVKDVSDPCINTVDHKIVWLSKDEYALRTIKLINSVPKEQTPRYYLEVAEKLKYNHFYELAAEYLMKAVNYQ